MPDGRAIETHMVAENNRVGSRSVWDGTITQSERTVRHSTHWTVKSRMRHDCDRRGMRCIGGRRAA
jgi:hypothetical protein